MTTRVLGIDGHTDTLVVAAHGDRVWSVPRTPAAVTRLATQLAAQQVRHVVIEPSGGDARVVLDARHAARVPVALVHPRRVRAWITEANGVRATTDPRDARMLAASGATPAHAPHRRAATRGTAERAAPLAAR